MKHQAEKELTCQVCHKNMKLRDLYPTNMVRNSMSDFIKQTNPSWNSSEGYICHRDLTRLRLEYVRDQLEKDRGELSSLDNMVLEGLEKQEIITQNVNQEFSQRQTLGENVADQVAVFGGSWKFIIFFAVIIVVWIGINTYMLSDRGFDPYPFILLNLILSCLAALQAPVIMMSQNRQEAKDRVRAEHDYIVNLKAELEIRNLTAKVDQLLTHQWQTLMEIQQIQTETMNEISSRVK